MSRALVTQITWGIVRHGELREAGLLLVTKSHLGRSRHDVLLRRRPVDDSDKSVEFFSQLSDDETSGTGILA